MTAGGIRRTCRCRDTNRKLIGAACPKLSQRNHGTWEIRQELASDGEGGRRVFRRKGYTAKTDAQAALDRVRELLNLAEHDEDRDAVASLLLDLEPKDPLPEPEAVRRRLRAGQPLKDTGTIGEDLDAWLPLKKGRVRRATFVSYESHVRLYLKPKIGQVRRDRLSVGHLVEMFNRIEDDNDKTVANNDDRHVLLRQIKETRSRAGKRELRAQLEAMAPFRRPVGPSSQQRILATLRVYLNDRIGQQELTFNPAAHYTIPAAKPKPIIWTAPRVQAWQRTGQRPGPVMVWTPEQAGVFLDHVADHDPDHEAMWHLMVFRGPRRGEVAGLGWTETHLDQGSVEVTTQLTEVEYEIAEGAPKSAAGIRTIPVDTEGIRLLDIHQKRQDQQRQLLGPAWVESGRVFTKPDGAPLRPSWIGDQFQRLYTAAGLPPIRLHDLRHVAATLMLTAGIDMKVIQETLGHSALATTSDLYTSVLPQLAKAAAEATVAIVPRKTPTPFPDDHASSDSTAR